VLVLVFLTVNVRTGLLAGADQRIREAVQDQAKSSGWRWLEYSRFALARLMVNLGNSGVAVPVLVLTALVVAAQRRSLRPLLTAGAGFTLLVATVIPAKMLIGRAAAGQTGLAPSRMGGFPSGQTAAACVCYGLAVLLIGPEMPARIRRIAVACLLVLCFFLGAALVWCGYHWFTDVVAGWALAAVIVPLAMRLTGAQPTAARSSPEPRPLAGVELLALGG